MGLAEYKRKRNFGVTAEPKGGKALPKKVKGASRFVIQKHDASRLHYDFRLEMDGVLKSWAVPKGLPLEKGEKHLAVEVEDHPVEYATFEGVIPEGQYGGGTVMLWDEGTYSVFGENPLQALKKGRLHLVLDGKKVRGEWALIRTRMEAGKPQWLLLKATEDHKRITKKSDDQSAVTGRSMKKIASDRDAEWESNRADDPASSRLKSRVRRAVKKKESAPRRRPGKAKKNGPELPAGLPRKNPGFISPMKPKLVSEPPAGEGWVYELKFDGIRALAVKKGRQVQLVSRNGNQLAGRFPEVSSAFARLGTEEFVVDGEVVALDPKGRTSFQLLQSREADARPAPLCYYAFDLLQASGHDLTGLPLRERKELLEALLGKDDPMLRYSGEIGGSPEKLLREIQRLGLEGIIGKRHDSVYEAGRRSGAWIKLKCLNEQEFVIGGFTPPAGSRKHFGAVLVGYYEKKRLLFAGKVGTGFDGRMLRDLARRFEDYAQEECPFADLPSKAGGKWVQGITPAAFRRCHWLRPELVCQVRFAEWTREGKLRQPVFHGLREDKAPREVVREKA